MMETTVTPATALAERVAEAVNQAGSCSVLDARQSLGKAALESLEYPTTRNERWKYTRVAKLRDLRPAPASSPSNIPPVLADFNAHRLTFVDGQFQGGEIVNESGVFIGPLSKAAQLQDDRLKALDQDYFADNEWFAALQAAAPQDGACILIPDGQRTERPILVHHHLTAGDVVAQPQHVMVVGENAHAEVILWTTCDDQATGLMNGALTADVAKHGHLSLEIVQDEQGSSHHIAHQQFRQAESSRLTVRTATARAHWLRNDLHIHQGGQHGHSTFHGCYLPSGNTFVDHHTRIDHAEPDGHSDELYKGLAADTATAVFNGKIMVHKDAQRIEAYQRNANLLLGERSGVYSKPELEIYADDVRCSHGCTIGQFDAEALFYLRSRGMTETKARNLMVQAFLSEVLDGFRPEIQQHVEQVYAERLGWN